MDSHFPLNVKIKLRSNFPLICMFLNNFENKLFLIKLKSRNIIIDLRHHVHKKKKHSQEADIKNRHQKRKCCDSAISKKVSLKVFIDNIEHKSNCIYLFLHFLF